MLSNLICVFKASMKEKSGLPTVLVWFHGVKGDFLRKSKNCQYSYHKGFNF